MKTFPLFAGGASLILGLYLFNNPFAAVGTVAWILAFFILISGINGLRFYFSLPESYRSFSLLIRSGSSLLIGFLLLTSSSFFRSTLTLSVVSVWLLILGISRLMMNTVTSYGFNGKQQGWTMIIIGLFLLIAPVFSSVFIGKLISILLLMIGVSSLLFAFKTR